MVVAGNGSEFDASIDHEIHQSRLHLGLTGLKVVAPNEGTMLLCKLNSPRNKGILGGTVDEWSVLKDASYSEDGGWGYLGMTIFDSLE